MIKLNLLPSKPARIVFQKNGDWYIIWYDRDSQRYRQKFGLNYVKDLTLRQRWANRILNFINLKLQSGENVTVSDIPLALQPPPFVDEPLYIDEPIIEVATPIPKKDITFLEYWAYFTKMKEDEGLSESWTGKFHTLHRLMTKFAESLEVEDFNFSDIDRNWATKFKAFCMNPPFEHSINYIAKNLKMIRQVLTDADVEADDIDVCPKYKSDSFRLKEVPTDEIALSIDEIYKLHNVDLSELPEGCALVRDNFIIGCLTALRWSDWCIKPENLRFMPDELGNQRPVLRVITQKTNEIVLIPLTPLAFSILDKYNFNLPNISNQKSNLYLKTIARMAGLNEIIQLRRSKGGKIITVDREKWQEVKTHTGRRTFITIALTEMKVPSTVLMKITGHKTERQLYQYARISQESAAKYMFRSIDQYFSLLSI